MSAGLSVQIRDTITPGMAKLAAKISDRRPILEAMLVEIDRITVLAFTNEMLRVASWDSLKRDQQKPGRKKAGDESVLFLHGHLNQSIGSNHVVTNDEGRTGTDAPYAAAHQFGYAPHNLPPRPFFPWVNQEQMADFAKVRVQRVAQDKMDRMAPK